MYFAFVQSDGFWQTNIITTDHRQPGQGYVKLCDTIHGPRMAIGGTMIPSNYMSVVLTLLPQYITEIQWPQIYAKAEFPSMIIILMALINAYVPKQK